MLKNLLIALVSSHLEFNYVIWSSRLIKDRKLIEGVQKRTSKFLSELRNIPYEERLRRINLSNLYYHQACGNMI